MALECDTALQRLACLYDFRRDETDGGWHGGTRWCYSQRGRYKQQAEEVGETRRPKNAVSMITADTTEVLPGDTNHLTTLVEGYGYRVTPGPLGIETHSLATSKSLAAVFLSTRPVSRAVPASPGHEHALPLSHFADQPSF